MPFKIHKIDDNRVSGMEYLPCAAIIPKVGMALKMSGGMLTTASGADKPQYLSAAERNAVCEEGELIPVIRAAEDIVVETDAPDSFTAVPGDKVQLSTDGMSVTNTTGGAAEVIYADSEIVRVRFTATGTAG